MAPTLTIPDIKVAEDAYRSGSAIHTPIAQSPGGIYHSRNISRASLDLRTGFRRPYDRRTDITAADDVEQDDEWRQKLVKEKQVFRGRTLLWYGAFHLLVGDS